MSFDFSKFDEMVDIEGLKEDIEQAQSSDGEFEPVPHGTYEVAVAKMELVETKTPPARPMLTVWFKIIDGENKGQLIFMNQVLTHGFGIKLTLDFLKSLSVLPEEDIVFEDFAQFGNMVLDIYEEIETSGVEYALEYGENKSGFDTFKIEDVFTN